MTVTTPSTEPRVSPLCAPGGRDARMARGKEIASRPGEIEKIGVDEWSVPSQTGFGRYRVWFIGDLPRCSCPDYESRAGETMPAPCKHIYAVLDLRFHEVGQSLAAPERKPRKQYAQHPTYTKGQTAEMRLLDSLLHDLVADVPDLPSSVAENDVHQHEPDHPYDSPGRQRDHDPSNLSIGAV